MFEAVQTTLRDDDAQSVTTCTNLRDIHAT